MARRSATRGTAASDIPTLSEESGIRYLHFNSEWIQGAMRIGHPTELVLAYTQQMMAWMMFLAPRARDHVGILGLGAGSLLRFTLAHTPARVHTVERNSMVTAMCRAFFRLPGAARSTIDHEDAQCWVADPAQADRYLALMVDLYDAQAQGPVCDSLSFYRDCRRVLAETGIMTVNLFGRHESYARNMRHICDAFDGRVLRLPEVDEGNVVVLAFKGPALDVSCQDLMDRAAELEQACGLPCTRWARTLLASEGWNAVGHVRI
ncbi:spermidine synthase [Castellaniella sp. GW247-6E4]|uniref:spermidine synthase n=1 Tax=Castellaniella sp. GW247-6E4 TaxID=3140380 RepID=UPI003315ACA5